MREIEIPEELRMTNSQMDEINLLIGDNGSGKSELLKKLAERYYREGRKVVAIANSIYDKFPRFGYADNYYTLCDRAGRRKAKSAIKRALASIDLQDLDQLRNTTRALEYAEFAPKIGIKLKGLIDHRGMRMSLEEQFRFGWIDLETLTAALEKLDYNNPERIYWIELSDFSFKELISTDYLSLVKYEAFLKGKNIIRDIEFFFERNGQEIPLLEASSGELGIVTTSFFLAALVESGTVILIDEPENSLHPKWQKQFGRILLDNFYRFEPKIVIATHSPLLVNGEGMDSSSTRIFKASNFSFELHDNESENIEAAYADYFDVITPANRMLSKRLIGYLNDLERDDLSREEFEAKIQEIRGQIFDDKQGELLNGVLEIAEQL